jgi:3-deoxy-manno-octulosonate cytidylyltransferase (CMP-KDO synthetase)
LLEAGDVSAARREQSGGGRVSVLVVIPARLAAVRLPRKPLRDLAGAPLVVRVWERVAAMGVADRVLIATESEEVRTVAGAAGAECVLTKPTHASGTDRVAEVAARAEFRRFDIIVNVQGDEPFLGAEAVRGAVEQVRAGAPLGTAAVAAEAVVLDEPSIVKVVCADDGRALYFSRAPIPFLRDAADAATRAPLVRQHLGVYAYTPAALAAWVALPPHALELVERLEQLRPLAAGMSMGVATVGPAPLMGGIDTEADLVRANALWTAGFSTAGRSQRRVHDHTVTSQVEA